MSKLNYQYFLEERARFQQIMGDKSIMTDERAREAAKDGLIHLYYNITCSKEELELAARSLEAALKEYMRRCQYIDCGV